MKLINDSEDKNIKTQSGNRIVPLHPKLIDLGLLNYVTEIKNKNETKLFPNLKKSVNCQVMALQSVNGSADI